MDKRLRAQQEREFQAVRAFIRLAGGSAGKTRAQLVAAAMLNELTPRQREIAELYYINRLTMAEIGARLGVAPSTVSRSLRRSRLRLAKVLRYGGSQILNDLE